MAVQQDMARQIEVADPGLAGAAALSSGRRDGAVQLDRHAGKDVSFTFRDELNVTFGGPARSGASTRGILHAANRLMHGDTTGMRGADDRFFAVVVHGVRGTSLAANDAPGRSPVKMPSPVANGERRPNKENERMDWSKDMARQIEQQTQNWAQIQEHQNRMAEGET